MRGLSFTVVRAGVALVMSLVLAGVVAPAVALASTPSDWGWVTVRKPSTASYTPAAKDQGNSAGAPNTVVRQSLGTYLVTFGGLDSGSHCPAPPRNGCGGTVLVTALSAVPRLCYASDLRSIAPVTAYIQCFDYSGALADSRFSVNYLATFDEHGTLAYLYADGNGTGVFTPQDEYNYNSAVASANTEEKLSTGSYRIHLHGMYAGSSGNLQIAPTFYPCKMESHVDLASPVPGVDVFVQCVNYAFDPVDATFFLTFADGSGLTGIPGHPAAYLFANQPTAGSYHPQASFRYSSAGKSATIRRTAMGVYSVTLKGMPLGGSAQVSAFGDTLVRCQLGSIRGKGSPQVVGVRCFDAGGNPADSQFYLSYTH